MVAERPIRVLQIVTQMARGGLETMLMNYYRNIDRDIIQFDFLEHRDSVTDYDREITELNGRIYRLPKLNLFNPAYLKSLDKFFKEHKEYQIVHAHMDCLSGIPLKYAKKHDVPVRIAHAHSISEINNIKYPIKLLLKKAIPKNATDYFACGQKAGEWMFNGNEFSVLNNAIDAEKYSFREDVRTEVRREFGFGPDTLVVGHVGNFGYPKNHQFLLEVFAALLGIRQNCRLILVGDGSLRKEIEEKCRLLGITDRVILTGLRTDVDRLLQAMDVFVFPSHYEGVSLVTIEAQAAGLPCIFSDSIPAECIITEGLVEQMSIQQPADEWAGRILAVERKGRMDSLMQIRESGFDVKQNAAWLQNLYLEKLESAARDRHCSE